MYKCYLRKGGRIHLRLQCRKLTSLQACNTDTPLECRECRERDYWLAKLQRFQLYIYIYLDMNFSTATNFPPSFARVLTRMASRCWRHEPHLPMQHWLLQVSFLRRQGTMFNGSNSILLTCVCLAHHGSPFSSKTWKWHYLFMLNVMKSLNLIAHLLAWKHPITEFSLLPSWLWHPRTAAPETLVWHPFIIPDDHLEFKRYLIFSES